MRRAQSASRTARRVWALTCAVRTARSDVLVETLVEELYERLRLEFLRTYGTSVE